MGLLLAELAVTALFVGLGVLFSKGKGAFLIAGYNTMSKEKKARYDKNALCRFMGKLMFALAACWVPVALGAGLGLGGRQAGARLGQPAVQPLPGVVLANGKFLHRSHPFVDHVVSTAIPA